ncbi:MAG: hypothetical protein AAFN74_15315 [Myxococcota bacterium]
MIDDDFNMTIAGETIEYTFDPSTGRVSWTNQIIRGNVTNADNVIFSVTDGIKSFSGSIQPRAQDGPVRYTGTEEPVLAFVGAYDTVTGFNFPYTPLIIDASGNMTIAGEPIEYTFDPETNRVSWTNQVIRGNVTNTDNVVLYVKDGLKTITGFIRPRAEDGPVEYNGEQQAVLAFIGTYDTETEFGFLYTPLVIDQIGRMTIAGDNIEYTFDASTNRALWTDQVILGNVTSTDNIVFSVSDGRKSFTGSIRPRAQDGPVRYTGQARF